MPLASSISTPAVAATPASYPKLLQGNSGSVWLVTGPRTGVIVHLSARPQKAKHFVGYASTKLEEWKMTAFQGEVKLSA